MAKRGRPTGNNSIRKDVNQGMFYREYSCKEKMRTKKKADALMAQARAEKEERDRKVRAGLISDYRLPKPRYDGRSMLLE
jgi:hypothetical protein